MQWQVEKPLIFFGSQRSKRENLGRGANDGEKLPVEPRLLYRAVRNLSGPCIS